MLVQLHAQWRYAKSFHVLFFGAAGCTSPHDGALSVLELTRWRSGVRVPTSLPFSFFQSLADAAFSAQHICVAVCAITFRFATRDAGTRKASAESEWTRGARNRFRGIFRHAAVALMAVAIVWGAFARVERERNKQEEYKVYSAYLSRGLLNDAHDWSTGGPLQWSFGTEPQPAGI